MALPTSAAATAMPMVFEVFMHGLLERNALEHYAGASDRGAEKRVRASLVGRRAMGCARNSRGIETGNPESLGGVRPQPRYLEARTRHERIECLAVVLVGAFRPAEPRGHW